MLSALLLFALSTPLTPVTLPIPLPGHTPPGDVGVIAFLPESYTVAADERGARWAGSWMSRGGESVLSTPETRSLAVYALFSQDGQRAFTWSSPERQAWGPVDLGVGRLLDLVIERNDDAEGAARWVAIRPGARQVVASGKLPGRRCGAILADDSGYILANGPEIVRFQPKSGALERLHRDSADACLSAAVEVDGVATLLWIRADGALRMAPANGGEPRTVPWPGPPPGPNPLVRALPNPEGGFWLFYAAKRGAKTDATAMPGLWAAPIRATGEAGAPIPLSGPSKPSGAIAVTSETWDVQLVGGRVLILRVVSGGPLHFRPVAAKPEWTLVQAPSARALRLSQEPGGVFLWSAVYLENGNNRVLREPLPPLPAGGEAALRSGQEQVLAAIRAELPGRYSQMTKVAEIPGVSETCVEREPLEALLGPPSEPASDSYEWTSVRWKIDYFEGPIRHTKEIRGDFERATGCLFALNFTHAYPSRVR